MMSIRSATASTFSTLRRVSPELARVSSERWRKPSRSVGARRRRAAVFGNRVRAAGRERRRADSHRLLPTYHGDYTGRRYSTLKQIIPAT